MGMAHEAAADPERGRVCPISTEHLRPKSASSLRFAVKAARFDYVARVRAQNRAVESALPG